jgi:hypothetical protein
MSKMLQLVQGRGGHNPRLDTILEIEQAIKKKGYFNSKTALFRSMHNKVQYPTLLRTLIYLENSNKIEFNKDGSIIWIFLDKKNKAMRSTLRKSTPLR